MTTWTHDADLGMLVRYTPTDEQRSVIAAPIDRPIRLVAGAGSGKTETVANRFVWLVVRARLDPTRILALTFTEKAASELEGRISEALHRNNVAPPQGRLYIHTFHGLCSRILSQHAYESGLPGEVDILDEVGARVLLDRIFESQLNLALEDGLSSDDLQAPPFDSCAELSKTVYKIMQDARGLGWEPDDLDETGGDNGLGIIQEKFYSAIERFYESAPTDGMEAISHLQRILVESGFPAAPVDEVETNSAEARRRKDLIRFLGYDYNRSAKAYLCSPRMEDVHSRCSETRAAERAVLQVAQRIYRKYCNQLSLEGQIDFNELIQRTVRQLNRIQEIRDQYRDTFQYVLIDEFQDTSRLQAGLTDLLCRRHRHTGGPANLMITGDRKQSIYVWRYARPRNLAELIPDEWVGQGHALEFFLTKNFRSAQKIIDVANELGPDLEPGDRRLEAQRPEEGEVYASSVFRAPKGTSISDTRRDEAAWVAETVRYLDTREENPTPYSKVAVLVRDRKRVFLLREALAHLGIPASDGGAAGFFEEPLIRDVIAYLRTIADPHDDVALCRILERPPVGLSDRQIYLLGTAPSELAPDSRRPVHLFAGLMRRIHNEADALAQQDVPLDSIELIAARLSRWIQQRSILTAGRFIEEIAHKSGILSCPLKEELQGWAEAYEVLRDLARSLAASGLDERVDTFVDLLDLYQGDESVSLPQAASHNERGVRIMTIHQAKGLEFDACFTLGLKLPQQRAEWGLDEDWGIFTGKFLAEDTIKSAVLRIFREPNDEERRIAYVACTRAKQFLATSHCTRSPDEIHPYAEYFGPTSDGPGRLSSPDSVEHESPAFLKPLDHSVSAPVPRVIETSFSALEMVNNCPVRYWISRNWGLPEWFGQPSVAEPSSFGRITGQVFHNLVAEYYTARWFRRPFDAGQRIETHLRFEDVAPHSRATQNIHALWEVFSNSEWALRTPDPTDVERSVRWVVATNRDQLVSVRGRIDLIDREGDGSPAIKDFKTEFRLEDTKLHVYAIQGLLYSKALGIDDDSSGIAPSIIHVTSKGIKELSLADALPEAETALERRLARLVEIESSREIPEPPSDSPCRDCCYTLVCPKSAEHARV
ncbi:MAG: ATP-dependent DNA helicase [bacterium]